MKKITKKDLARKLQRQESRIDRLVEKLARKGFYDDEQEQADHDEVLIILDSKEPKPKVLDQSVASNKYVCIESTKANLLVGEFGKVTGFDEHFHTNFLVEGDPHEYAAVIEAGYLTLDAGNAWQAKFKRVDDPFERNSLIERDKVELTGSDLCRKMLERGDKFVMCQTASGVDVISGTYEDGFFVSISNEYEDVTPINNQGEPLTAAEVGL